MKWLQLTKVVYERVPPNRDGTVPQHRRVWHPDGPYWVNLAKATSLDRITVQNPGGPFSYTVVAYCAYGSDGEPGSCAHQPVDYVLEPPDEIFHLAGVSCARSEEARRG